MSLLQNIKFKMKSQKWLLVASLAVIGLVLVSSVFMFPTKVTSAKAYFFGQSCESGLSYDGKCANARSVDCHEFYKAQWDGSYCSTGGDTSFDKSDVIPYSGQSCGPNGDFKYYIYGRRRGGSNGTGPVICAYYPNQSRNDLRWLPQVYSDSNGQYNDYVSNDLTYENNDEKKNNVNYDNNYNQHYQNNNYLDQHYRNLLGSYSNGQIPLDHDYNNRDSISLRRLNGGVNYDLSTLIQKHAEKLNTNAGSPTHMQELARQQILYLDSYSNRWMLNVHNLHNQVR